MEFLLEIIHYLGAIFYDFTDYIGLGAPIIINFSPSNNRYSVNLQPSFWTAFIYILFFFYFFKLFAFLIKKLLSLLSAKIKRELEKQKK